MAAIDIFGGPDQYTTYLVKLQVTGVLVGGVPSSPSVIKGWLMSQMKVGDRRLQELVEKTLEERFPDRQPSAEELADALMSTDAAPNINGFKRIPGTGELAYEGRCMKAALKEWANSAYPGTMWPGKADIAKGFRKGLMETLVERVFVPETYIGLGVTEPTRVEERIKHVMTPRGPRNSISRVEVVERPTLEFHLRVRDDFLPTEAWSRIWQVGEEIGIGADRARGDGRFELLAFDRL